MQTAENVVNSIVDLDARAEDIRAQARGEADAIRRGAHEQAERDRVANEAKIAERVAAIESASARSRGEEIARVRKEYTGNVEAVNRADAAIVGKVVDMIVARIKGTAR
jgi:hypothetical protein